MTNNSYRTGIAARLRDIANEVQNDDGERSRSEAWMAVHGKITDCNPGFYEGKTEGLSGLQKVLNEIQRLYDLEKRVKDLLAQPGLAR